MHEDFHVLGETLVKIGRTEHTAMQNGSDCKNIAFRQRDYRRLGTYAELKLIRKNNVIRERFRIQFFKAEILNIVKGDWRLCRGNDNGCSHNKLLIKNVIDHIRGNVNPEGGNGQTKIINIWS